MKSKIALITGANRGIGFELARQLGRNGWLVYVGARGKDKAESAAAQLPQAKPLILDVADGQSIARAKQVFAQQHPHLDLLVNNAAILLEYEHRSLEVSMAAVLKSFQTNSMGPLQVAQAFAPLLLAAPAGQIINVSSELAQLATMDSLATAYRISKVALNAITRVLHDDLHPQGVRVNSVCPGWVRTAMGGENATLDVVESAAFLVDFISSSQKVSGGFFQFGRSLPW